MRSRARARLVRVAVRVLSPSSRTAAGSAAQLPTAALVRPAAARRAAPAQALAGERADPREQARRRGRDDRDVVALRLGRQRVSVTGHVDGELRFGRFAAEAFGAVEDERGVPRAAVGRADRLRPVVGGGEQRRRQPGQRHNHIHGAGCCELAAAAAPASREAQGSASTARPGSATSDSRSFTSKARPEHGCACEQPGVRTAVASRAANSSSASTISSHHHRVHRVAARGDHLDRQQRQGQRRREAGARAPHASHGEEEQRYGGGSGERLGQLERGRVIRTA